MKKVFTMALGLTLVAGSISSCKKGEEDPSLSLRSRKARLVGEWTVQTYTETSKTTDTYEDDSNNDGDLLSRVNEETITFDNGAISIVSSENRTYDGDDVTGLESTSYSTNAAGSTITVESSQTDNGGTSSNSNEGTYSSNGTMTVDFIKDGTCKISRSTTVSFEFITDIGTEDETQNNETVETEQIEGTWSFIKKNKADEFKNRERIAIWYKSTSSTETETTDVSYSSTSSLDYTDTDNSTSSTTSNGSQPDEIWELVMLKNKEIHAVRSYTKNMTGTYSNTYTDDTGSQTSPVQNSSRTEEGTTDFTLIRE